jgi:NAD(P)-dependent dehydrogenase (short-subunit alcohol dehydrogenase family)
MAKVFITGSADGLGLLSAKALADQGHHVVLHARNAARANEAKKKEPRALAVLTGDLSNPEETKQLANAVNDLGKFDAIIHNAGVYRVPNEQIFAVNTLAPYVLTSLIHKPGRLIYLSSGMHLSGRPNFDHFMKDTSRISYSDSKLHVLMLSNEVSRKWPDVYANAVDPGWVPTKMGGPGAPDDLHKGYETQTWLAASDEEKAKVSGHYFHHQQQRHHNPVADDARLREQFMTLCAQVTGIRFPSLP